MGGIRGAYFGDGEDAKEHCINWQVVKSSVQVLSASQFSMHRVFVLSTDTKYNKNK